MFTYLFLARLGLRRCTGSSLVAARGGCSLVVAQGPHDGRFSCCQHQALEHLGSAAAAECTADWASVASAPVLWSLLLGTWDLPRSGMELVSPALAGEFFTPEPAGKPHEPYFLKGSF